MEAVARTPESDGWVPRAGQVVAGKYRVGREIGGGGMGAVVSATHLQLGQEVALKFLHPRLALDAHSIERFVREARAAIRIKSDHVVRVFDVGATDAGLPFLAMELLVGCDLGHELARGPLSIELAVDCVIQASEALAAAHGAGIVHRDVKPSNIWLARGEDGSPFVKMLDFGISKLAEANPDAPRITETQAVFGSPFYMSPEQVRSAKNVTAATDVWALGVVLHELLTTSLPFRGESAAGVLASVMADAPPPLRTLRPDVPAAIEGLVLRCLVKSAEARISLHDLVRGLTPFASSAGARASERQLAVAPPRTSVLPPSGEGSDPFGETVSVSASTLSSQRASSRQALTRTLAASIVGALLTVGIAGLVVVRTRPRASVPIAVEPVVHAEPTVPAIPPASLDSAAFVEPGPAAPAAPGARPRREPRKPASTTPVAPWVQLPAVVSAATTAPTSSAPAPPSSSSLPLSRERQ